MKKFYAIFLSIILFIGCFTFFSLESHAEDFMYRYTVVNNYVSGGNPNSAYSYTQTKSIYSNMRIAWVPFYIAGNLAGYEAICSQSAYSSVNCSYHTVYGDDRETSGNESVSANSYISGEYHYYILSDLQVKLTVPGYTTGWENAYTTGYCFTSLQAGLSYVFDNEVDSDDLDGDYGSTDLPSPPIDWGQGPDEYGELRSDIPAPEFRVVYDSDGNIKHSIEFTNTVYNSREHGVYGLVLSVAWASIDDVTLLLNGSGLKKGFTVDYSTFDTGPLSTIYDMPVYESQIVRCPHFFNFDTNDESLIAFNSMLNSFPISNRTINHSTIDSSTFNHFTDFLGSASCPYNTPIFSCYYYRVMSDGKFYYGPSSTGSFSFPVPGTTWYWSNGKFNVNGDLSPTGSGGGFSGSGPGWSGTDVGNTGFDVSNLDASEVINNMNGIFGLVGEFPSFLTQIIGFLPQWLIVFIAVAIALLIAIGLVKMIL